MRGMITVADAAQMHSEGKVSALGAFWTSTKAGTVRSHLIMVLRLDTKAELGEHTWVARLVRKSDDSEVVTESAGTFSVTPVEDAAELPDGQVPPGGVFTIRARDLELAAGLYAWQLYCDEGLLDEWEFSVLADED
jgi:hypothetical protein